MSKIIDDNKKIEDKFVETFLKQDGETIKEAKEKLKKGQKMQQQEHHDKYNL